MTAVLINASPKRQNCASAVLLEDLAARLPDTVTAETVPLHTAALPEETLAKLQKADTWVIAFPLYVDGLPSHLLSCLAALEEQMAGTAEKTVRGIVNCGFYEGIQTELALNILRNWCLRMDFTWGGGIGVGGGGAITSLPRTEKGPMAPVCHALRAMGEQIARGVAGEDRYLSVAFPKPLYRIAAQMSWRREIKANGGRAKDLSRRVETEGGD